MTKESDVQAYLDWQSDQFMVPVICHMTEAEARENMAEADEHSGADREYADGYYARLSAPGYLDATDWLGPYDTETEAAQALYDMYGDDMPDSEDE